MDSPRTEEDNKRDARIWENLKNNPTFQEETNRRRAARWAGNDPDKPARVPRWKRRRDGR
jgi:hypothetical protein